MGKITHPFWWETFLTEYLKNGKDATAAYLKARPGHKPKSAKVQACRLLTSVNFRAFMEEKRAKLEQREEMTREKWLGMLCDIAGFDVREYLKLEPSTGDVQLVDDWKDRVDGHAIEEVFLATTTLECGQVVQRVRLKRDSKLKALEMIGKALGYLKDKVEHSGNIVISAAEVLDADLKKESDGAH